MLLQNTNKMSFLMVIVSDVDVMTECERKILKQLEQFRKLKENYITLVFSCVKRFNSKLMPYHDSNDMHNIRHTHMMISV